MRYITVCFWIDDSTVKRNNLEYGAYNGRVKLVLCPNMIEKLHEIKRRKIRISRTSKSGSHINRIGVFNSNNVCCLSKIYRSYVNFLMTI